MNKDELSNKLLSTVRAEEPQGKKKGGVYPVIAEQKETIESLLKDDYSLSQIVEGFNKSGVKMTLTTFRKHWNEISGKKKKK